MYNLILKEVGHNQRTWYNSGIGTYAQPSWKSLKFYLKVLSHKIDLAIAWCVELPLFIISCPQFTSCSFRNFERTILAAYQWLSDNYEPGDCIFLFGALKRHVFQSLDFKTCLGFSRGAYQVRVLSAMIDKVSYVLLVQVPEIMSPENYRSASSIRETRRRYHCTFQNNTSLLIP